VQTQKLYSRYLHRAADAGGLHVFANFLSHGGTLEQAAVVLIGSPEYRTKRGGNTDQGFLDALYQDALGRPIDASGQATFSAALTNGASHEAVAGAIPPAICGA
jgi:hypothetical protein